MILLPSLLFMISGRHAGKLVVVGIFATGYGIYLIKRGIEGDTLMPGTNFTYLPRWLFFITGAILQLPLPAAIWYLDFAVTLQH